MTLWWREILDDEKTISLLRAKIYMSMGWTDESQARKQALDVARIALAEIRTLLGAASEPQVATQTQEDPRIAKIRALYGPWNREELGAYGSREYRDGVKDGHRKCWHDIEAILGEEQQSDHKATACEPEYMVGDEMYCGQCAASKSPPVR